MTEMYAELLLETAKHPAHAGVIDRADLHGESFNSSCGDQIAVTAKTDGTLITDLKWQGTGCIISRAHMDALAEKVIGSSLISISQLTKSDMLQLFGFDETMAPGREKCLLIGLKALQQASEKYLETTQK